MDIESAYLQAKGFARTIYVRPPKEAQQPRTLWRLNAAADGLTDSGRLWYLTSNEMLIKEHGLTRSRYDYSFYHSPDRTGVADFVEQWSGSRHVEDQTRSADRFPEWDAALAADLRAETRRFAAHVVFDGAGSLDALLTAPYTVTTARGAQVYGVADHGDGLLELDPTERAG